MHGAASGAGIEAEPDTGEHDAAPAAAAASAACAARRPHGKVSDGGGVNFIQELLQPQAAFQILNRSAFVVHQLGVSHGALYSVAESIDGSSVVRHRRAEQEKSEAPLLQDSLGAEHLDVSLPLKSRKVSLKSGTFRKSQAKVQTNIQMFSVKDPQWF